MAHTYSSPGNTEKEEEQIQQTYAGRSSRFAAQSAALDKRISYIAYARLAVFAAAIGLVWLLWPAVWGLVAVVVLSAALFIYLVRLHNRDYAEREHVRHLKDINDEELARLQGQFEGYDAGEEFTDGEHPYTADLDIFGEGGIYQYVSRACTSMGRERLAAWLQGPATPEEIARRQEAVREMTPAIDWRQHFQAGGRTAADAVQDRRELLEWIQQPAVFLPRKGLRVVMVVFPIITLSLIGAAIFAGLPTVIALLAVVVQIGIVGSYNKAISAEHSKGDRKHNILGKYAMLIKWLEQKPFKAALYQELYRKLEYDGKPAGQHIRSLAGILQSLDNRYNALGYVFANGLYMRELYTMMRLERWKEACRPHLAHWLEAIAEADALLGFATLSYNHPEFCVPEVRPAEEGLHLEAEHLGHPLISAGKRVGNPVHISGWGQFMLVTGSNMAGKSTYLRAVGVNMVLALAGAPVCASRFSISPVLIYSSMRVGDSIRDSESTFYAELKRLRRIIEMLSSGEKIFIILDEILRGTNSKDKLTGSIALMRQLIALEGAGIIATHDLQLGELAAEYPGQVHNHNFEVTIEGDHFTFDYKLKDGICKTLNATQLMRQMGIRV